MTKKDYVRIADAVAHTVAYVQKTKAIQEVERQVGIICIAHTANALADTLGAENPSFDRARFLAACGIEG